LQGNFELPGMHFHKLPCIPIYIQTIIPVFSSLEILIIGDFTGLPILIQNLTENRT